MCDSPPQIIVLGPPGAGKGTQAARLAKRLDAIRVSIGELLREWTHIDPVGSGEIAATMAAGGLVPDDVVDRLVREFLETLPAEQGFVLDGYPRSPAQAERLRSMLAELGRLDHRPLLVWLEVPRDELVRRLRRRAQLEGRADDAESAIERRLDLHAAQARTVLAALERWTAVRRVDGTLPASAVTHEILESLCARTAPARSQPLRRHGASDVASPPARPNDDRVTLFLRVYPSRQQYRLPKEEEAGSVTKALAEVLGARGCVVLGYELPDEPDSTAVVLINGNVVECAELIEIPHEPPRA